MSVAPDGNVTPMNDVVESRRYFVTGGSGFIGSHLLTEIEASGARALNFDMNPPLPPTAARWEAGDVCDAAALTAALAAFEPTHIVHLAARVDVTGDTLDDYRVNMMGADNVIAAVQRLPGVRRVVFTSTQFVCRPGYEPANDGDYAPHTLYGESKVRSEKAVRQADLDVEWTIVRPTTIWGPGDLFYRSQFYRVLQRGLYLHPGTKPCLRSYGYVGNVASQIRRLAEAPSEVADRATFYVGDDLVDVVDFVSEFSRQLKGKEVRVVPAGLIRGLGLVGDGASKFGITFPITSGRYQSMVEDYPVPIGRTLEALGPNPYSLSEGVGATIEHLRATGFYPAA